MTKIFIIFFMVVDLVVSAAVVIVACAQRYPVLEGGGVFNVDSSFLLGNFSSPSLYIKLIPCSLVGFCFVLLLQLYTIYMCGALVLHVPKMLADWSPRSLCHHSYYALILIVFFLWLLIQALLLFHYSPLRSSGVYPNALFNICSPADHDCLLVTSDHFCFS